MKASPPARTKPAQAKAAPGKKPSPPAAKAAEAVAPSARTGPAKPHLLFLQSDGPALFHAMRGILASGKMRYCGMILDDRIAGPFNFYRYVYTRVAEQPRLIHPDHHPRLFSDFLAALPRLGGESTPPGTGFLLGLPIARPRGSSAAQALLPHIHARLRKGEARLLHVATRNKLRLLAEAAPGRDLPVDRLPVQLQAHQRVDRLLRQSLAKLPNTLLLDDADLFSAEGQAIAAGQNRLEAFLARPAPLRAGSRPVSPPAPLSTIIPNFAAIAAKLRDTPFAWMTDDPAPMIPGPSARQEPR